MSENEARIKRVAQATPPTLFTAEQSWKMSEPERVAAIIRDVKVWRLGNCDGCVCCRFSLRNVDVDISCGKGGDRGIWISSPSMDYGEIEGGDPEMLRPIADEVKRQIENYGHRGPVPINFGKRP